MSKIKNSNVGRRAWSFVRLALLWARKGGVFRARLLSRHFTAHLPKFIKTIGARGDRIAYMTERELSFDKSPVIHVKMHRPNSMRFLIPIPCINPPADFEYDFAGEEEDKGEWFECSEEEMMGVDLRAEEFIAQFYERMKLQRQISYLEYTDGSTNRSSPSISDRF